MEFGGDLFSDLFCSENVILVLHIYLCFISRSRNFYYKFYSFQVICRFKFGITKTKCLDIYFELYFG